MIYRFADCELDTTRFELRRNGVLTSVEPQVFDLLRYLVEHRSRLVSKQELFDEIWSGRFVSEATLSSRMMAARQAVGDSGSVQSLIRTARGRGFRFIGEVSELEPATSGVSPPLMVEPSEIPASSTFEVSTGRALLERSSELDRLREMLAAASAGGGGRIVLVHGEAGIGKSALVESFISGDLRESVVFSGTCDALTTPRPLGPLQDIARAAGPPLSGTLSGEMDRDAVLAALLVLIEQSPRTVVLVFEDLHWSDEATLDILISISRRIASIRLLLILTYRSDEVGRDHPLRRLLGQLPVRFTTRLALEPLSLEAIEAMRIGPQRASRIHALTGGNSFYVTEVLADPDGELPATVSDAVLGRVRRCTERARDVMEVLAASPSRVRIAAFLELVPGSETAIDEAIGSGLLRAQEDHLLFRHELGRRAVEESLPLARRRQIHRIFIDHYLQEDLIADEALALVVHHARAAGETDLIVRFAPKAAVVASKLGAHTEAAAHYRAALEYEDRFPPSELATLLEGLSYENYLTRDIEDAVVSRARALDLRLSEGEVLEGGSNLRWLSRLHWFAGRAREARHFAARAVETLSTLPPSAELAMAYSNRAQLKMLEGDLNGTLRWGERAIHLARELDDNEVLAHAMTSVGLARLSVPEPEGREIIEQALAISLKENYQEHAARAYTGLATGGLGIRDYDLSYRYLVEGCSYCEAHDLDSWTTYLYAYRARYELERGSWEEAERWAAMVLERPATAAISRIAALVPLALIRLRRGEGGAGLLLDEALDLARTTGELQRLAPVAAARAEAAWLVGDLNGILKETTDAYELAQQKTRGWELEHLSYWMWRGGAQIELVDPRTPFGLQVSGRWREAAERWRELGCLWELALALGDGDRAAITEATAILEQFGSQVAIAAIQPVNS